MTQNKTIIGVTGGSGSGKSTIAGGLGELGCYVIDADEISKCIMNPGMDAYYEIAAHFGKRILMADGTVNRRRLGEIVFNDRAELQKLNEITHKYIKKEILDRIRTCGSCNIVIDAAVIIGSNMEELCGAMVSVLADRDVRIGRIIERDGITKEMAESRIASQPDDEFYIAHSDYFVYNNNPDEVKSKTADIFRRFFIGGEEIQNKE